MRVAGELKVNKIISSGIVPEIMEPVIYGTYNTKIETSAVLINVFCVTDLPLVIYRW